MANNIDHLSYSTAKKIYRKGIDYAMGTKLGLIDETYSKAVDIGTMAHAMVLGGDPQWVVSPYSNFRTKESQEWRDAQTVPIITDTDFEQICKIADAVKSHPLVRQLITVCEKEQELTAKIDGVKFLGYADGISPDRTILFDLKTTAQFDDFKYKAFRYDYDLQAAIYRFFGVKDCRYYFIAAESIAPYRVQVFGTSDTFIEHGDDKLFKVLQEFKAFRDRNCESDLERITFNIGETSSLDNVEELGDWS
jgi:hypothetical protein